MELNHTEKGYEVTQMKTSCAEAMQRLDSMEKMTVESPQVNKIEDDSTSSHLEFEESSGATTVEGESRDECNDCSSHCVERNIIQDMKSELEFIKPENQSSEALEPSSTENIPLQCDSTIKSTVRSQELYEMHSKTIAKLTERQKVDEIEGCTFKPKVTTAASRLNRATKQQPIHELLFAEATIQREKQQQKLAENPKPTFAPDLKLTAGSPFNKRSEIKMQQDQSGQNRYEAQQAIMRQIENDIYRECTFTPHLCSYKNNGNAISLPRPSSPERLYKLGIMEREISENKRKEEAEARELEGCTFSPQISRLATTSGLARDKNIHERLYSDATLVSMRLNAKVEMSEVEKLKECTFKPSVGKTPSTSTAVHERLFSHATASAQKRLEEMLDLRNIDANCCFTPITNNEAHLDPKRTEALYNMGVEEQRIRARSPRDYSKALSDRMEAEDLKLCTFAPNRSQTKNSDSLLGHVTTNTTSSEDGKSAPAPPVLPIWERLHMHATTSAKLKEKLCEDATPPFMPTLVSKWSPQQKTGAYQEEESGILPPPPGGDNNGLNITPPPVPTERSY